MVDRPWEHDFFHALRLIDACHPDKPRLGTARKPQDEPVRLGQAADLSFAPSALHAVKPATATSKPRIEVRFFGLFGPNGPLPLSMTEYVRERELHVGDETFARFADVFHHRLLLLFYRAWAQAQPTVSLDRNDSDRFAEFVGALIGLGTRASRGGRAFGSELHHAGLLTRQVRNADGLAALLSGHLGRRVRVEQFAGGWLSLQPEDRTRIGLGRSTSNAGASLGRSAVLGSMVWDRQHSFRLHIGPLGRAEFESLLPDGDAFAEVIALVEQYVGIEFGWDLRLELRAEEVEPTRPGLSGRLGWTSWLGTKDRAASPVLALRPNPCARTRNKQNVDRPRAN